MIQRIEIKKDLFYKWVGIIYFSNDKCQEYYAYDDINELMNVIRREINYINNVGQIRFQEIPESSKN